MREIGSDESKKIQLEILQSIHEFCTANSVKYSICGGTLIGAVRHKGFIPWDDDIDIFMLREDYIKFIHGYKDTSGRYRLHCLENDESYCYPYAKVEDVRTCIEEEVTADNMGIAVDVFPVDNCMNDREKSIIYINGAIRCQKLYKAKLVRPTKNNSFLKKCGIIALKMLLTGHSLRKLAVKLSEYSQGGMKDSRFVATMVSGYGTKELQLKSSFDDLIELPFEDRTFLAIKGYDQYLSNVYGDYMKLPPVEKRRSPHVIEHAYWK